MMIGEICADIKNYFAREDDRHIGKWEISEGAISPILSYPTDYIRIIGSRLNDGVHKKKNGAFELTDESFEGAIWIMSPPADFLNVVADIEAWQKKNGSADSVNMSPFNSESFAGYSYSKASGSSSSANGAAVPTWQGQFANRLSRYRRLIEV